jgi:hypothetical protein
MLLINVSNLLKFGFIYDKKVIKQEVLVFKLNQQFQRFHSEDQSRKSPTKGQRDFRSQQNRQFRNDDQRRKYPTGYYRGDKNQASRFHEYYNNNFYQGYEDGNIYNSIDMRLLKLALGGWN